MCCCCFRNKASAYWRAAGRGTGFKNFQPNQSELSYFAAANEYLLEPTSVYTIEREFVCREDVACRSFVHLFVAMVLEFHAVVPRRGLVFHVGFELESAVSSKRAPFSRLKLLFVIVFIDR